MISLEKIFFLLIIINYGVCFIFLNIFNILISYIMDIR